MSEVIVDQKPVDSNPVEKHEDKFVARDAYQTVSTDMMKYKEERNNLKAELEKLKTDEQTRLEVEQLKNGEFQKLADSYKQKFEESEAMRVADTQKIIDREKLFELEKALGGFKKSEYASFAVNLSAVELDEYGKPVKESLDKEVTRIRQEHPSLLNAGVKPNLPNLAPGEQGSPLSYEEGLRKCTTQKELTDYMTKHGRL